MSAQNKLQAKAARREVREAQKAVNAEKYWGQKVYLAKDPATGAVETKTYPTRADRRAWNKQQRQEQAKEHHAKFRTVHKGRITTNILIEGEIVSDEHVCSH